MRFMVIVKATKDSEAGVLPTEKLLPRWESTTKSCESRRAACRRGLQPSSERVGVSASRETSAPWSMDLLPRQRADRRGLLVVASEITGRSDRLGQALSESVRGDSEIEIRQLFEAEDFGAEFTPELREQEERVRAQAEEAREEHVAPPASSYK